MLKIFNYHPVTLALLSVGQADPSPLEPGKWLIPAHATPEEPPEPMEGKALHFVDGKWEQRDVEQVAPVQVDTLSPQERTNLNARSYLVSTDWYVIRLQETGQAIPADVLALRQEARESVK